MVIFCSSGSFEITIKFAKYSPPSTLVASIVTSKSEFAPGSIVPDSDPKLTQLGERPIEFKNASIMTNVSSLSI